MDTILTRSVMVSRPAWVRAHDLLVDVLHRCLRGWQRWQAARHRAAEFEALRRLSPGVLQDIGALPEWQNAARYWREQRAAERDALFRGFD
jgi:hypothetical protein